MRYKGNLLISFVAFAAQWCCRPTRNRSKQRNPKLNEASTLWKAWPCANCVTRRAMIMALQTTAAG